MSERPEIGSRGGHHADIILYPIITLEQSAVFIEQYRIDVAKDLFPKESIFNEKARQYLSLAYRQMTNRKKFEKPKELDEFVTPAEAQEKARKYGEKLVEAALGHFDEGKPGEAARILLELVLMIVTPMSG